MREFHVEWAIEIDAETPEEAAMKCRQMQQNPQTTATVFSIWPTNDPDAGPVTVDLLAIAEQKAVHQAAGEQA